MYRDYKNIRESRYYLKNYDKLKWNVQSIDIVKNFCNKKVKTYHSYKRSKNKMHDYSFGFKSYYNIKSYKDIITMREYEIQKDCEDSNYSFRHNLIWLIKYKYLQNLGP